LAVRDQLRSVQALGLGKANCEITHDGSPFPIAGEVFVAVSPGYWRDAGSNGTCLQEEFGVNVTVSMRLPKVPIDRIGPELLAKANIGLLSVCDKIRAVIHMDPYDAVENSVLGRANMSMGTSVSGFLLPLQFVDGGRAELKPAPWFQAKGEPSAALCQTISFGKALRVQRIEDQS
jgi:hypothetical protein